MEIEKQPKIFNKTGISSYDKEYYKQYAEEKNKTRKHCSICDTSVSYYAWSKHQQTKLHTRLKSL